MSTTRLANQKRVTEEFIDLWRRLNVEDMAKLRTPDCIQESIPKDSLQMPDQDNETFIKTMKPIFATLSNFKVDVHSITHDADAGRSVLYANTAADATWGDYRNTHIMIFHWNDDGTKMTHFQDMMDSAGMLKRMELVRTWFEKQGEE